MSRIIVKNLPEKITEDKLRQLFGQKGTITDIQLKYTPDGKFRRFAFIGYQTETEADDAINYFNKMCIHTSRIVVERCAALADVQKPKSWSKYAADSTKNQQTQQSSKDDDENRQKDEIKSKKDENQELLEKYKNDPLFEEFLQVHAPEQLAKLKQLLKDEQTTKIKDDSAIESGNESTNETDEEPEKLADQSISDLEYMKKLVDKSNEKKKTKKEPKQIELFTVKLTNLPYNYKKRQVKQFLKPLTPFSIRCPRKIPGIAYIGFKEQRDMKKALLKNKSFANGHQVFVAVYDKHKIQEEKTNNTKKQKWKTQEESLKNQESIGESGKIFLRNLPYTTTEDEIEKLFSQYGDLAGVNLPIDKITKKIKGFGTVTFLMPENAVKAFSHLDGTIFHGRMLHLLPAKDDDVDDGDDNTKNNDFENTTNYKLKKSAKQKSEANSGHNWNSLFLGHDAVAEVIADNYNTTKENVLGVQSGSGSAAVKLALGETEIVAQTRKYLEQQGVILDAFNTPNSKRSKTVILIKNLPHKTTIKEIREKFDKFGMIDRIILPPSGITAVVEFLEPTEARKAFTNLAYTKFKNVPLYLEWAPENVLTTKERNLNDNSNNKETIENQTKTTDNSQEQLETKNEPVEDDDDDEEPEPDTTLFVKNLNFKTTDEDLRKHFEQCGKICYANVATKKDVNNPQNRLSMGYGFIRFIYKKSADEALKTLQQSVLDGKSVELKRSERTLSNEVKTARKTTKKTQQNGTKILVRNVPFQAKLSEIRELFSTFGEIRALRLPKKMSLDGGHRGFAFVDYTTTSDAKNAFEALSQSTHLYGRRLVLEWATSESNVDEIRKRTADHFQGNQTKKSKKTVFNLD